MEIRSCSAEQVTTVHLGSMVSAYDGQPSGSVQCLKSEGSVWNRLVHPPV
jgi:hypothetical protein